MEDKRPWQSKTYWVNVVAALAVLVQLATGKDAFSPELQALVIVLVNLVLRKVTKSPVGW